MNQRYQNKVLQVIDKNYSDAHDIVGISDVVNALKLSDGEFQRKNEKEIEKIVRF